MRTIKLPDWSAAVAYSSNGSILAVGGNEFSQLFDSATGERRAELEADCGPVLSVSFSCNDRTLATASRYSIRLWDVNTGSFITELRSDGSNVYCSVTFHPRIDHVLVAYSDGHVWAWDVRSASQSISFEVGESISSLCWLRTSGLQQHVLVGCENENMEIWDVELSRRVKIFSLPPFEELPSEVTAVASSYDGSLAASGSREGRVIVYNTILGHSVHCFQLGQGVMSVAFSPTEQMLACASQPISVHIFYLDDGRVGSLDGHQNWVLSVAFSPDGQFLTSTSSDKTLNISQTSVANSVALDEHYSERISSIQFLRNGNLLLTHSISGTNKIWDTGTGALYVMVKTGPRIRDAVSLFDGTHVVSLSYSNTLSLWDRQQGKPLYTETVLGAREIFPYSPNSRTLGFISIHRYDKSDVRIVYCWVVDPMHTDGPRVNSIARGKIPLNFQFNVTQVTHTSSMEEDNLMLIIDSKFGRKTFFASWNNPVVFSEQLQELYFVEDSEQFLVEDVPDSLVIEQVKARTSKDRAWILNEHGEKILWLLPVFQGDGYWYGQKLAVGGESGRIALVDFLNISENDA
jgi:WD40 repeat protein